jgi:hypothetical protein
MIEKITWQQKAMFLFLMVDRFFPAAEHLMNDSRFTKKLMNINYIKPIKGKFMH